MVPSIASTTQLAHRKLSLLLTSHPLSLCSLPSSFHPHLYHLCSMYGWCTAPLALTGARADLPGASEAAAPRVTLPGESPLSNHATIASCWRDQDLVKVSVVEYILFSTTSKLSPLCACCWQCLAGVSRCYVSSGMFLLCWILPRSVPTSSLHHSEHSASEVLNAVSSVIYSVVYTPIGGGVCLKV